MKALLIAFSMYSRLPVPDFIWEEEDRKKAMCFFPLVGVLAGAVFFLVYLFMERTGAGPLFKGALLTAVPLLATGGIHMDGFLDTCDARASWGDREKKLQILKDTHAGAFAVIGGGLYLLLYCGGCSELPVRGAAAVSAGFVLSRALSGLAAAVFPGAREHGMLADFMKDSRRRLVAASMVFYMAVSAGAMQEDIKLIDLIIELVDARAPLSSRNPDIDDLGRGKARMVLLNKADLASEAGNAAWTRYFEAKGFQVMKIDARQKASLKQIHSVIQEACKEKIERDRRRGILNRPVRAMVAGIPNVGKSTFINSFAGKAAAKTGNKPGVTKGNQWIRLNKQVELLDTPGILWPKFEDQSVGLKLAFLGSINDEILNKDELAAELCAFLLKAYPGLLAERYGIPEDRSPHELLEQVAIARSCLLKGGGYDVPRAARLLLEDFRSGKLGRITLEFPENPGSQENTNN